MKRELVLHPLPSFQRYDCQLCGACCRAGFAVVTTAEERERIQRQGWNGRAGFAGRPLFVKQPGGEMVVAQDADGACVFLGQDHLCRIHAEFGEEAKPFACRPYPFVLLPAGNRLRVSLRFDCPAVVTNTGRPLPDHAAALQRLAMRALPREAFQLGPPEFRPGLILDWHRLGIIARAFEDLISTERIDITRRLLICADLVGLLEGARLDDLLGRALENFLGHLKDWLVEGVAHNPLERKRPAGMLPVMFRQAAGLYARLDKIGETQEPMLQRTIRVGRRFSHSLRILAGRGAVPPIRPGLPRVDWADMECSFGIPSGEAAEALTRYYRVKLGALGFCGRAMYGWPFLEGAGALFLTYPLILWFARLLAAGDGKCILEAKHVQEAIRVVDRPHGNSVALALRPERIRLRFLSEHENLSTLIVWYGT